MDIDTLQKSFSDHWDKATAIRMLSVDGVEKANSGHPGMPMGMADVVTVLFEKHFHNKIYHYNILVIHILFHIQDFVLYNLIFDPLKQV